MPRIVIAVDAARRAAAAAPTDVSAHAVRMLAAAREAAAAVERTPLAAALQDTSTSVKM